MSQKFFLKQGFISRLSAVFVLGLFSAASAATKVGKATALNWVQVWPSLSFQEPLVLLQNKKAKLADPYFVVERQGLIWRVLNTPEGPQKTEFFDLKGKTSSLGPEMGMLGLAFDPRPGKNYFYINYNLENPLRSRVSRFSYEESKSESTQKADPASEKILLEVLQPYTNHKGGQLMFGRDGFLYIGFGDGGSAGDPLHAGQNLSTYLGKILRIDVSQGEPYAIPKDNPFAEHKDLKPEIWAYGLRNPWRFSQDPQSGDLWISDVGQDKLEEINRATKAGLNFGWSLWEGKSAFTKDAAKANVTTEFPYYQYTRKEGYCVIGGFVYRGQNPALSKYVGQYIFGDFGSGKIWAMPTVTPEVGLKSSPKSTSKVTVEVIGNLEAITSFGEDNLGEIFALTISGKIYRWAQGNK